MFLDLCRSHHWENLCTMSHLYMTSRGILEYISLGRNMKVFDKFKEFKDLVENQTEKIIKVSRTDNGGEFCNNEFE
jgi:hypothetical protein